MGDDIVNFYIFYFHVSLLFVKVYAAYFLSKMMIVSETPIKSNYMFVFKRLEFFLLLFNILFIFMETYFIYGFYNTLELLPYESIAMLDQIIMTITVVYILKKRGQHEKEN